MTSTNGHQPNPQTVTLTNGASLGHNGQAPPAMPPAAFDRPVLLRQSPLWSQLIVWTIAGVTGFALLWACIAKVEQAVQARGKLEPIGAVKEIQAPVGGVVDEVFVEDGESVAKGDVLVTFDPTASQAQLEALEEVRAALVAENNYYRSQMSDAIDAAVPLADVPPELLSLTRNRAALVSENRLYQSLLDGDTTALSSSQLDRLNASQAERFSRVQAATLAVNQVEEQLQQNRVQLQNAREVLATNQTILERLELLYNEGGVAELQYIQQQQEVSTSQAEVASLEQESQRLEFAIAQARQERQNAISTTDADLYGRLDANEQRIAQIDSQLAKVIVENDKQIEEIDSQLRQAELTLTYQELRSPEDGVVFDMQAGPGFVANTSEPILTIVPRNSLVAEVFITNQDIGFVQEGMTVDVRIDSFPYSEFGDVQGKITRIGSDALPPDDVYPFYRFPAEIEIEQQFIEINGNEVLLQSGMAVSANIRVRDRRVITMFTDLFTRKVDSLKTVR